MSQMLVVINFYAKNKQVITKKILKFFCLCPRAQVLTLRHWDQIKVIKIFFESALHRRRQNYAIFFLKNILCSSTI